MNLYDIYKLITQTNELTIRDCFDNLIPPRIKTITGGNFWKDKSRITSFLKNSPRSSGKKVGIKYRNYVAINIQNDPTLISYVEQSSKVFLNNLKNPITYNDLLTLVKEDNIPVEVLNYIHADSALDSSRLLTYLIICSLTCNPSCINQYYISYLYRNSGKLLHNVPGDDDKFIQEFPPDGQIYEPNSSQYHIWTIENTGEIIWEKRKFVCVSWINGKQVINTDKQIFLPEFVYPGDSIDIRYDFITETQSGYYAYNWKMVDMDNRFVFPWKAGLGIHYTVYTQKNMYCTLPDIEKKGFVPHCISTGNRPSINCRASDTVLVQWTIKKKNPLDSWEGLYFKCMNSQALSYSAEKLDISINSFSKNGEQTISVEINAPSVQGEYKLIWFLCDKDEKIVSDNKLYLILRINM